MVNEKISNRDTNIFNTIRDRGWEVFGTPRSNASEENGNLGDSLQGKPNSGERRTNDPSGRTLFETVPRGSESVSRGQLRGESSKDGQSNTPSNGGQLEGKQTININGLGRLNEIISN